MKIAMINGLAGNDPKIKACWQSIPCIGEVSTPEEFIAYTADVVQKREYFNKPRLIKSDEIRPEINMFFLG